MNFQIYENGKSTKGVFDTLDEAKVGAKVYLDGASVIEIKTINSMAPEEIWRFDYEIDQWVAQR